MNGEYMRTMASDRFYELSVHALSKAGCDTNRYPLAFVKAALDTCRGKLKTFSDLAPYAGFYFTDDVSYDAEGGAQGTSHPRTACGWPGCGRNWLNCRSGRRLGSNPH